MTIQVAPDRDTLAVAVAAALGMAVRDRHDCQPRVDLCLTGGSIAAEIWEAAAAMTPIPAEFPHLHLWWGDERFVDLDSSQRNDGPALAALSRAWRIPAENIHRMPSPATAPGGVAEAAALHARELGETIFDLALTGVGPDGHILSVFPDHPGFAPTDDPVIAVGDSPKPPPERVSLSLERLLQSRHIWVVAAGAEKAAAVSAGLAGATSLPVGHLPRGKQGTWWLDAEAAHGIGRPAPSEADQA